MLSLLAAENDSIFGGLRDFFDSDSWIVVRNLGLFFGVVFWLAVAYWVFKDARRRIEDPWLVGMATILGLVPPFVVQMKYSPVMSRLPFGNFQYASLSIPPLPDALTSVIVGATTSVSSEPFSLKQTISLMRGAVAALPLLAHATC